MWNQFKHWLHHLFTPHCLDCAEKEVCKSCEILKQELAIANHRNKEMSDALIGLLAPKPVEAVDKTEYKPIMPRRVPWNVKRAELEAQERNAAQVMAQFKRDATTSEQITPEQIQDLEIELGVAEKVREGFNAKS